MARRLLVPLAAAALVLGAAGCGPDEPEPRKTDLIDLSGDDPSDGGGAEPSDGGGGEPSDGGGGEPVNAAPDIPAPDPADFPGMDENTEQGAISALRYYVAVSVWANQTGDDSKFSSLEADSCNSCENFYADIEKMREFNQYWEEVSIEELSYWKSESDEFGHEVTYQYVLPPHSRPDLETGEPVDVPAIEYIVVAGMTWDGGKWLVSDLAAKWGEDVIE